MNLSEIVDADGIIDQAFKQPSMRIKPRSKIRPSVDLMTKTVLKTLEQSVSVYYATLAQAAVDEMYLEHELLEGDRASITDATEEAWDANLEEKLEAVIEPWNALLSSDWLARNTIAVGLHETDGIPKFCAKLGEEIYKTLTYKKTPNQIMSNAGIVQKDLEERLNQHINPTEEEQAKMSEEQNEELDAVVETIALHVGKDFDALTVYDDIALASDDDEYLSMGAAPRLGLDADGIAILQGERLVYGNDLPDVINRMIEKYHNSNKTGKKKAAAAPKPATGVIKPKGKGNAAPEDPDADTSAAKEGGVSLVVFEALKHCGVDQSEISQAMGVSRATFNNWANEKTQCNATDQQLNVLRQEVVDRINKLHEALGELDAVEPEVVF